MASVPTTKPSSDFLIRGTDYLAANPDFELVGRKKELNAALDVLLRKNGGNNLIMHGQNGVGLSSIIMGIQAAKEDPATPFDIVSKEFFYLDVDALFASSSPDAIEAGFQETIKALEKSQDAVLVIEDTKGFLDGIRNNNASNLVNVLMRAVRTNPKLQTIFEADDGDLKDLLDLHSDIRKDFSLLGVDAPEKDEQREILDHIVKKMEEQYGVTISKEAVDTITKLTEKYPTTTLGLSQPKRSATMLEGALTAYCRTSNARPAELGELEKTLETIDTALKTGQPAEGDLSEKSPEELEAIRLETQASIEEVTTAWDESQKEIRSLYTQQLAGETEIDKINTEITRLRGEETATKEAREQYRAAEDEETKKAIKEEYQLTYGTPLLVSEEKDPAAANAEEGSPVKKDFDLNSRMKRYSQFAESTGAISPEVAALEESRKKFEDQLEENKQKYAELLKASNTSLNLTDDPVLTEFSRLSKVDMGKLKQDDNKKLLNLEESIRKRVFGQDEAVTAVSEAIRIGKTGLKEPNVPIGTFLFLGPTGVGKTELAKAVTETLFGDENALHVYNMPEYSQENDVTKMIGSPPGYDGYDAGGRLTNDMMDQPSCVNLFDEAEKAHPNMFDILLRIADEGRLTDNHGREVFFGDSINILTSNIGAKLFLDDDLSPEDAREQALEAIVRHVDTETGKEVGFRPEFLARLDGIFCFTKLDDGQIKLVALKNLTKLNGWLAEKGDGLSVEMSDEDVEKMCKDNYNPHGGARGIMKFIKKKITSAVTNTILTNPGQRGVVQVGYDEDGKELSTAFIPAAANEEKKPATPPAAKRTAQPSPG